MTPTSADDLVSSGSSLQLLGEALAATASLAHLGRLVVRLVCDATRAERVALLVRDESGRLRAAADVAQHEDGRPASRDVVALPLLVRAAVEGIVVVQDGAERSVLDTFLPQAAWAVGAVRAAQTGGGDGAAARARITGQVLHEVNNRLGAIQIYAYLLTERLRRGEDAGGLEIAGKLCGAVERLGASLGGLATTEAAGPGARGATDLDALVDGCLRTVSDELAGRHVHVRREPGTAGAVLVHEASMAEALGRLLRELGAMDGARLAVTTQRRSPQAAAIVVESAVGMRRVSEALFSGESDELGGALGRDVIERQACTISVSATGEDGIVLRLELVSGTE